MTVLDCILEYVCLLSSARIRDGQLDFEVDRLRAVK